MALFSESVIKSVGRTWKQKLTFVWLDSCPPFLASISFHIQFRLWKAEVVQTFKSINPWLTLISIFSYPFWQLNCFNSWNLLRSSLYRDRSRSSWKPTMMQATASRQRQQLVSVNKCDTTAECNLHKKRRKETRKSNRFSLSTNNQDKQAKFDIFLFYICFCRFFWSQYCRFTFSFVLFASRIYY